MSYLDADRRPEALRRVRRGRGLQPRRREGRVRVVPRAVRLRQDDDAPDDRGLRAADLRHDHDRRRGHHPRAAEPPQRRHGLPVLRAVPEHDRRRQHRVRAEGPEAAARPDQEARRASSSRSSTCPTRAAATRTSSRAASSSASRWRAPSPSSPRSSSSTSRCPRSTPRSASPSAQEIRQIQRQLGITTVYVTHDQEEALSLSDRVVVMSEGRMEQVGTPVRDLQLPGDGLRGVVRRDAQRAAGPPSSTPGAARSTVSGQPVNARQGLRGRDGPGGPARAPAGDGLARGSPVRVQPAAGKVVDVSFLGSIVRIRVRAGGARRDGAERGQVVILDEFNEPTLKLPSSTTASRSASRSTARSSSTRRRRSRRSRRSSPRRDAARRTRADRPARRDRSHRLRQGRHPHRVRPDVGRLGRRHRAAGSRRRRAWRCARACTRCSGSIPTTGLVFWHGLLAATPMARIREAIEAFVAAAGAGDRGGRSPRSTRPGTRPIRSASRGR